MKSSLTLLVILWTEVFCAKCTLQVSIPKSGTHALKKCIDLILGKKENPLFELGFGQRERFKQTPEQFRKMLKQVSRISTHLVYNTSFAPILTEENGSVILSIRHPLDLLVSWAHYIIKKRNHFPRAAGLSFEAIVDSILDDGLVSYHITPKASVYALPGRGLKEAYEKYLLWMNTPNILVIRFEELVGPQGGGNLELQKRAIENIAEHLGVLISQDRINQICKNLFGGTTTFRQGRIGAYKEELSPQQLERALRIMQPLIDRLGYNF